MDVTLAVMFVYTCLPGFSIKYEGGRVISFEEGKVP